MSSSSLLGTPPPPPLYFPPARLRPCIAKKTPLNELLSEIFLPRCGVAKGEIWLANSAPECSCQRLPIRLFYTHLSGFLGSARRQTLSHPAADGAPVIKRESEAGHTRDDCEPIWERGTADRRAVSTDFSKQYIPTSAHTHRQFVQNTQNPHVCRCSIDSTEAIPPDLRSDTCVFLHQQKQKKETKKMGEILAQKTAQALVSGDCLSSPPGL